MQPANHASQRLSNMELLRIISMLMVLAVHFDGASLGLPQLSGNVDRMNGRQAWQLATESITIIGVNCFTLLSGYFGIKLRVKSVAAYLFQCIFYAVGIATVTAITAPNLINYDQWLESWLVLTHTDLWYVPAYFALMLLSPFLNAGFSAMSRKSAVGVTLLFILFNIWAGWWWGGKFNPNGYTIAQLIMMYMTGRTLSLFPTLATGCGRNLTMASTGYVAATAGIFVTSLYMPSLKAFAYNAPFVICASVALFITFMNLHMQSRAINYIARSAFAVYLLHKSPIIWTHLMKPTVYQWWQEHSLWEFSLMMTGLMIVVYIAAMLIDPLRRMLSDILISTVTKSFKHEHAE